jgi:ectoine hydroxylase-related dioxygenase (phytanoyl-CoA dioxygenase family)
MSDYTDVRRDLARRGWSVIHQLFDAKQIQVLRDAFDSKLRHDSPSSEILYTHSNVPSDSPGMANLMTQWLNPHKSEGRGSTRSLANSLIEIMTEIMKARPVLFQDILMMKEAGHSPFEWHQDYPFWPVDSPNGLILWVPAQDVNSENGGLGFADGSHLHGAGPSMNIHTGLPQAGTTGHVPTEMEQITPELKVGDALIFTSLTWHRSDMNNSVTPRLAWSSTWLHPESRWDLQKAPNHPLSHEFEHGELVSGVLS